MGNGTDKTAPADHLGCDPCGIYEIAVTHRLATDPGWPGRPERKGMTKGQVSNGSPTRLTENGAAWYPSDSAKVAGVDSFAIETHRRYRGLLLQTGKVTDAQLQDVALIAPKRRKGRPRGSARLENDVNKLRAYLASNAGSKPTTAAVALFGNKSRADYVVKAWREKQRKKT